MPAARFQKILRDKVRSARSVHFDREYLASLLRKAMSVEQAKQILGFDPGHTPTHEEVAKAYKNLAFKNHPDRGGDPKKMVEINVAKDILEGKRVDRDLPGPGPSYTTTTTYKRTEIKDDVITFEEAMAKAGVPHSGVEWKFVTKSGSSKTHNPSTSGFVVYGKSDTAHIFVAVSHYNYYPNELGDRMVREDFFHMNVQHFPLSQPLVTLAPKVIRQMYANFEYGAYAYSAKVALLPAGITFTRKLYSTMSWRWVQFKDAMGIMGEISNEHPWVKGRKVTCECMITGEIAGEQYMSSDGEMRSFHTPVVALIFNGREFQLKPESVKAMQEYRPGIMNKIFGQYQDRGAKKSLSRKSDGKQIMQWMVDNFKTEPPEVIDLLKAAIGSLK
mgnify:FL=1